jgi:hypothetical protein
VRIVPLHELQAHQDVLEALIAGYLHRNGWPPCMSRQDARRGVISLLERGDAVFVEHDGEPVEYGFLLLPDSERWRA